jgi:hypothetical protein
LIAAARPISDARVSGNDNNLELKKRFILSAPTALSTETGNLVAFYFGAVPMVRFPLPLFSKVT